jgi:uncharacterized protein YxeA
MKFFTIIIAIAMLGFITDGVYSLINHSYDYKGVVEMTQQEYTSFVDEYGFNNEQSFATAYNEDTDKLLVTYSFKSNEENLTQYGIDNGTPNYGTATFCFVCSGMVMVICVLLYPTFKD